MYIHCSRTRIHACVCGRTFGYKHLQFELRAVRGVRCRHGVSNIVSNKSESFRRADGPVLAVRRGEEVPETATLSRSTPTQTTDPHPPPPDRDPVRRSVRFIVRYYCRHYIILFFDRAQSHYGGLRPTGQRQEDGLRFINY